MSARVKHESCDSTQSAIGAVIAIAGRLQMSCARMPAMTRPFARPEDVRGRPEPGDERPGVFPYTRGIQPTMYRGRLWTMRQYAGFGTAAESNARYRYLLAQGVSGLSVAFDLPTQMGYDSDHPLAAGEVGRVGVAIDSIEDMAALFDGIPLDRVSTSMTINATAIILLALYVAVARRQGVPLGELVGHDPERHPQGVHRARHLHLSAAALAAHRHRHLRVVRARAAELEHDLDQRLPHPRGRLDGGAGGGVHARQRHRLRRGGARGRPRRRPARPAAVVLLRRAQRLHRGDREVPRRAAAVGAPHARPLRRDARRARMQLRFHTQTAGSTLTAQQPDNNIVRVAMQALAAVLGGTQSLHCNGRDEALALPTEEAARIALRTQQIIAAEIGRRQHGRSARRRVGDRGAHRRRSSARRARSSTRSTRPAARSRPSKRGRIQRQIQDAAYARAAGDRPRRDRSSSASTATRPTSRRRSSCCGSIRRSSAGRPPPVQARARRARDAAAWRAALDAVERAARDGIEPRAADHRAPSRRARRSARSPTRCGASSASTVSIHA